MKPSEPEPRTLRRWLLRHWPKLLIIAVVVIGGVVGQRLLTQANEDANRASEVERALERRGLDQEAGTPLATALIEQGVSAETAALVVAALSDYDGGGVIGDLEAAQWLATWEETDTEPHDASSHVLIVEARNLGVTRDGLADFLRTVTGEQQQRQLPPAVVLAGLSEHTIDYAYACELVEGSPCSHDVVLDFVLDRQQVEYERWGHVDCRVKANIAHPGCVTYADCADEYAVLIAALDASNEDWATAESLGHEVGSDGWEEWTAASDADAAVAEEAHETCIAERYGEDPVEAMKALVLAR